MDADATRAERDIDRAARDRRVNVDADTRRALTRISRLTSTLDSLRDETVEVDVSTDEGRRNAQLLARELTNLSRRAWRASLTVDDSAARARLRQLQAAARAAARRVEIRIEAETAPAMRGLASLRTMLGVLSRDVKIDVDANTSSAVAAMVALRAGLDSGSRAISRFNRYAMTMRNIAGVLLRVAIVGLVGAIGPLVGIATVAGAALTALAAGAGLLAAPMIASVAAMAQHKTASEGLETANEQLEDRTRALVEAEENLQKTEEEATRSVEQAAQARADAAEQYRRTQVQAAESEQDARARVADQERALAEAQRQDAERREEALETYRASVADLRRIEEENAERLRQAYQARREAEAEYARTVAENRRRIREATDALRQSEEELADARQEAARMVAEARARAEERYESALEAARDAADRTEQAEEDLADQRERSRRSLEDLRDAQRELNEAMEDEPRRQAEAALDVRESELELSQLEQQIAEARTLGDTDRVAELEIRRERLRLQLDEERDRLNELQNGPSPELQRARERVEDAWRARQQTLEEEREARERLQETRREEQEARAGIQEARREGAEEIRQAQEEAASLVENAIGRVLESRQALTQAQRESAISERQAARAITESQEEIRRTLEENRRALEEGRQRAAEDYEALVEARRSGAQAITEQERALAEAIEQRQRTARQARWDVMDAREALAQSAEEERLAQVQAGRDVEEAQKGVEEALRDVGRAQDEVAEKASEMGATLTASQQALYAAAIGFAAAFTAAFAPAQDSLNYLGVEVLALAQQALPYLGGIALQTAEAMHRVFDTMRGIWTERGQLALFRRLFDAIPGIMEDAVSAILKFATGLINVFSAATPFVQDFFGWLEEMATRFLSWTQSIEGQRQLQEFFRTASFYAGIFADIIRDVMIFLFRIGQSEGAQRVFQNIAEFMEWLATNRGVRRGIQTALWLFGRLGDVILFFLRLPVVGSVAGFTLAFGALFALLGGGVALAALGFMFTFGRHLARIPGLSRLASRSLRLLRAPLLALRGLFAGLGRWAGAGVRVVGVWFARLPGLVFRGIRGIPNLVGRVFGLVPRIIGGVFRGAGRWFLPILSAVTRFFGGRGFLMGVFRFFAGRAGIGAIFGPAGIILATVLGFADRLYAFFQSLGQRVHSFLGRILEPLVGGTFIARWYRGFQDGVRTFMGWLDSFERQIGEWARAAFNWIGQTMVWGWIEGLASRARDLWDYLVNLAKSAWEAAKSVIRPGSPSRLFMELGETIPQGLAAGIRAQMRLVDEAGLDLADRARQIAVRPNIAVRVPVRSGSVETVQAGGIARQANAEVRELLRGLPGYGVPITIPVSMVLSRKKLGEVIIEVQGGEAREARRMRGQMADYSPAGL